jgi:hypothetical protein
MMSIAAQSLGVKAEGSPRIWSHADHNTLRL